MYKKIFNRLPERFRKQNTDKLYYVLFDEKGAFFNAINSVEDSRNIDKATGNALDLLGANVGQIRQGEDDDLYRQLIKVRILANMSIGDIPTINTIMSTLVKDVYRGLKEGYELDILQSEPAAIVLDIDYGNRNIPYYVVDKIKAAGVRVLFATSIKHNIYIGMTAISGKKRTHYPLVVKDRVFSHEIFYGMAVTRQKKKRVFKKPDVFTTNYINMMLEVKGEGEVKLDYE